MILVETGAITVDDLVNALAEQRRTRRRLGEILIDSGLITWLQLAEAIAEQARDLDPQAADTEPEPEPEPELEVPTPTPVVAVASPPAEPPVSVMATESAPEPPPSVVAASGGRPDVELMLMERQRAFMELVSVTESLRATVTRLQDELAQRDAEIARLRAMALPAAG
jgi:hypothetical protein